MPSPSRLLALTLLAAACTVTLPARLGEKGSDLRKRFGRPEVQPNKNTLAWLIEEAAGPLLYTVTLDEQGISIAEGLKPYRHAQMNERSARNFMAEQLGESATAGTARAVKPGEAYTFGGENFVCGPNEQVVVDEAGDRLVIWTLRPAQSVMAVTRAMVQRTAR